MKNTSFNLTEYDLAWLTRNKGRMNMTDQLRTDLSFLRALYRIQDKFDSITLKTAMDLAASILEKHPLQTVEVPDDG